MNKALEDMLQQYDPVTPLDWNLALREVIQEIALLGLWRSGFFEQAAFYGGTALRIFHGLGRFSEDLDFSLISEHSTARLEPVLATIQTEMTAWGFSFEAQRKSAGELTGIESAFLKGNTRINLLSIGVPEELSRRFPHNRSVKVKLELDTTPPAFALTEIRTCLLPTPYRVRLYDLRSLFAGKLHALLFRDWKIGSRDEISTTSSGTSAAMYRQNFRHLEARIAQSGSRIAEGLDIATLQTLLKQRIRSVDLAAAAEEVRPFLRDPRELELWSEEFFMDLCERVT